MSARASQAPGPGGTVRPATVACLVIGALIAAWVANHVAGAACTRTSAASALAYLSAHLYDCLNPAWPAFEWVYTGTLPLALAFAAGVAVPAIWAVRASRGTFRRGEEHGSARWADISEMRAFSDPAALCDNTLLSKDVLLRYTRGSDFAHQRNRNVIVIGGSGCGKTRNYIKPNLMQIACRATGAGEDPAPGGSRAAFDRSFVVTDPKGTTRVETGHLFAEHGYDIKELNIVDFSSSMHYNPLFYVRTSEDAQTFVNCFIANTKSPDAGTGGDPFWEDSEINLLTAIIEYMRTEVEPASRNLITMCRLLDMAEVRANDPDHMDGLDILFWELESGMDWTGEAEEAAQAASGKKVLPARRPAWQPSGREANPYHPGVVAYNNYKVGAPETKQSVLITAKVRLAPIRTAQVEEILSFDEMELDRFGDRRMVLYAIPHDQDRTFNFLFAILLWQMLKILSDRALTRYAEAGGALPVGVDFLLDEAANFYIPNLDNTVATCRSRNIGVTIVLQSKAQLETCYDAERAETIVDCCDSMVFLGGKSEKTNKMLEEMIGSQTVTTDNTSQSKQSSGNSMSTTLAQHARALIQSSEIAKMPKTSCLVLITGANPWIGDKYDVTAHPLYPYIDPGHRGSRFSRGFDMRAYRSYPRYYETEASLSCSMAKSLDVASVADDGTLRETVRLDWRIEVSNVSGSTAYNVRVDAEVACECTTNEEWRRAGKGPLFPDVCPARPDPSAIAWRKCLCRTNLASPAALGGDGSDVVEWSDMRESAHMDGVDLASGKSLFVTIAYEIDREDLTDAVRGGLSERERASGPAGLPERCEFLLSCTAQVKCANADGADLACDTSVRVSPLGFVDMRETHVVHEFPAPAPHDGSADDERDDAAMGFSGEAS